MPSNITSTKPMPRFTWLRVDAFTLALSGFPIRIERHVDGRTMCYTVHADGYARKAHVTLDTAKRSGERVAREMLEFMPELLDE